MGDFKGGRLLRSKPVRIRRLLSGQMPMTTWVTGSSPVMTISGRGFAVGRECEGAGLMPIKLPFSYSTVHSQADFRKDPSRG